MSNSQRRANPRIASSPDYVLKFYGGPYYAGMSVGPGIKFPHCARDAHGAQKLRGAGLASAERALKRRGYIVERVRVE